jgi:carboxyl-terminal processing protease
LLRYVFAIILAAALAGECATSVFAADRVLTKDDFKQDFDFAWREIASTYAYFDDKATVWQDVPSVYKSDLEAVSTREQFVALLERMFDELYDPHAQLTTNTPISPRLVPSGTDIWAEWRDGEAVVTEVRNGSDAQRAGIKSNSIVVAINSVPIDAAVAARMGRTYTHSVMAARAWALRAVLAGTHNKTRTLQLREGKALRAVQLPARDQFTARDSTPVSHSTLRPGVGYIRINDSLGDDATVAAFDRAIGELRESRALIIDLRNTPSGGNSSIARAILGRFVIQDTPYQKHVLVAEQKETGIRRSWLELVSPRGEFIYQRPVAVLVDHWTGSMAEGLAIGFDATNRGTVVGTQMAQLVGATYRIALPRSGIGMNVPAERLYHVDGMAREAYQPKVVVDVARVSADDPFVTAALRVLGE